MQPLKRIRIGNQTSSSAPAPMVPFDYALANGFDAFEWFPDRDASGRGWDEADMDGETRRRVRDLARDHDIALSVHASLQADPTRPGAGGLLEREFGLARDLGAELVNIHLCTDQGLESYLEAVGPFISLSAEMGLRLSIENTPSTAPEDFNRLFEALARLGREETAHVGMCLDLGHANLCAETRNDYMGFIDRLDPVVPVIHLHVHENYGDRDSHLTLFTGPAGRDPSGIRAFVQRMEGRGFTGSAILEQWPEPPSLLNEARKRLLSLFSASCRQRRGPQNLN